MAEPTFTVGPGQAWPIRRRALRWPVAVLVATVFVAACTKNAGWFSVGGSIIAAIGARLWAARAFRLKERADDPLPPVVLEQYRSPTTGAVPLNSEHFNERMRRYVDNIEGVLGVGISIAGGIIASVVPFVASLFHVWTPG
jgi:hypothetical protein